MQQSLQVRTDPEAGRAMFDAGLRSLGAPGSRVSDGALCGLTRLGTICVAQLKDGFIEFGCGAQTESECARFALEFLATS